MKTMFFRIDHRQPAPPSRTLLYEIVRALIGAVLITMVVLVFFFRTATVDGESMKPTLQNGDRLLISNFTTRYHRGDIVVISRSDDESLVKRVIATGGDTLDIDFNTGEVRVNGVVQNEKYIAEATHLQYPNGPDFPLTVPDGCVFVMGDNRNDSLDSRSADVGIISTQRILGKMLVDLSNTEAK